MSILLAFVAYLRILFIFLLLATLPGNFLIGSLCGCVVFVLPAHRSRLVRFSLVFQRIPIFPLSLLLCLVYYVTIFGSLVTTIVLSTFLLMPMWHCGNLNPLFASSFECTSAIVSVIVLFVNGLLTVSSGPLLKRIGSFLQGISSPDFFLSLSVFFCLYCFCLFRCVRDVFARRHRGRLHWWYCCC